MVNQGIAGNRLLTDEIGEHALARFDRDAGLRVLVATIGPFAGAVYPGVSTPGGLAARRAVNDWIRTTDAFDGVFDVALAVQDPADPDRIHPALDAGDGMHLNDEGARVMADTVNVKALLANS